VELVPLFLFVSLLMVICEGKRWFNNVGVKEEYNPNLKTPKKMEGTDKYIVGSWYVK
jgi:hypothetical protein